MKRSNDIEAARRLYREFAGRPGDPVARVRIGRTPSVMAVIGEVEAIAYGAWRDGEHASYQHEFAPAARPLLGVSPDGRQLYLIGGSYRFTDRGIEDVI